MQNLLDPAILFFVFGVIAGTLRSNLEIPQPISRFLSLYLLMALGLKGGFALAHSGFTPAVGAALGAALTLAIVVPVLGFAVLRRFVAPFDAAAIAATYGSVSAVTFVTAVQYLDIHRIAYGGHMAAALALMESPAIMLAVLMANVLRNEARTVGIVVQPGGGAAIAGGGPGLPLRKVMHESMTDGAQLLLLGSMVVGVITGDAGKAAMQPFSGDLFKGMLAFFLLDMGLSTARSIPQLKGQSPALVGYAVLAPVAHAGLALLMSRALGLTAGDGALLTVLAASASYIAVPAVLRYAIPEANPSLYFSLSLGLTFPLNIIIGIPLYTTAATHVLGG